MSFPRNWSITKLNDNFNKIQTMKYISKDHKTKYRKALTRNKNQINIKNVKSNFGNFFQIRSSQTPITIWHFATSAATSIQVSNFRPQNPYQAQTKSFRNEIQQTLSLK